MDMSPSVPLHFIVENMLCCGTKYSKDSLAKGLMYKEMNKYERVLLKTCPVHTLTGYSDLHELRLQIHSQALSYDHE